MKTKPLFKLTNMQLFAEESNPSLAIVNGVREEYDLRIPEATRDNIEEVGNTIIGDPSTVNTFFTGLLNRIAKTVVKHSDDVEDIYSAFGKEQELPFGKTVQKIFVDIPTAKPFKGADETTQSNNYTMLHVEKGVIYVEYTTVDRKFFYKTTISVEELKEAFLSADKLDEFVSALISSMARALSYDKYIMDTHMFGIHCEYVQALAEETGAEVRVIEVPEDVVKYNKTSGQLEWGITGAKQFLKLIKKQSGKITFPHKLSFAGYDVETSSIVDNTMKTIRMVRTPKARQVIALENDTMAEIDVDALAVLFNLEPARLSTQSVTLEDGALGLNSAGTKYVMGFIADKDLVERGKSFDNTDSFKNPESLYVNFWNHYWGYRAVSKFGDFLPIVVTAYTPTEESNGGDAQ